MSSGPLLFPEFKVTLPVNQRPAKTMSRSTTSSTAFLSVLEARCGHALGPQLYAKWYKYIIAYPYEPKVSQENVHTSAMHSMDLHSPFSPSSEVDSDPPRCQHRANQGLAFANIHHLPFLPHAPPLNQRSFQQSCLSGGQPGVCPWLPLVVLPCPFQSSDY